MQALTYVLETGDMLRLGLSRFRHGHRDGGCPGRRRRLNVDRRVVRLGGVRLGARRDCDACGNRNRAWSRVQATCVNGPIGRSTGHRPRDRVVRGVVDHSGKLLGLRRRAVGVGVEGIHDLRAHRHADLWGRRRPATTANPAACDDGRGQHQHRAQPGDTQSSRLTSTGKSRQHNARQR